MSDARNEAPSFKETSDLLMICLMFKVISDVLLFGAFSDYQFQSDARCSNRHSMFNDILDCRYDSQCSSSMFETIFDFRTDVRCSMTV